MTVIIAQPAWQSLTGQAAVKRVLIDLGGKAKLKDIEAEMEKRYGKSRADTTNISLSRLRRWKEVQTDRTGYYWIVVPQ